MFLSSTVISVKLISFPHTNKWIVVRWRRCVAIRLLLFCVVRLRQKKSMRQLCFCGLCEYFAKLVLGARWEQYREIGGKKIRFSILPGRWDRAICGSLGCELCMGLYVCRQTHRHFCLRARAGAWAPTMLWSIAKIGFDMICSAAASSAVNGRTYWLA